MDINQKCKTENPFDLKDIMEKNDKKLNKIPYGVEFSRTKKQFLVVAMLGYVGETPEDAAYFYKKLSGFLDLETSKKVGELWRDTYTDPTAASKLENCVQSLDCSRS